MATCFPTLYEDELLYSIIARYHYYSGNISPRDTIKELFGDFEINPSILFASNLELLVHNLTKIYQYSSDYFISRHTIYPLVDLFISGPRQVSIVSDIKRGNGKNNVTKLKILYKYSKKILKYCPLCAQEEFNAYKESYFHRTHQVFGVHVCHKHGCILLEYPVNLNEVRRSYFIRFDISKISLEVKNKDSYNYNFLRIAKCVKDILASFPTHLDNVKVYQRYLTLLNIKGFCDYTGQVNCKKFAGAFKRFYDKEFLAIFDAHLDVERDPNDWLSRIIRKPFFVIHPIKHILLILFLCDDFHEFLDTEPYSNRPFGSGPWPCLNPVADHYKEKVISKNRIVFNSSKKITIGYFTCSCGFTYRRVSSVESKDDILIGKVTSFGQVWENKLKELLLEKKYPLTVLASKMSCNYRTVLRYSDKLGLRHLINTTITDCIYQPPSIKTLNQKLKVEYTSDILDYIKQHPRCRRTDIQKTLVKQCSWLSKFHKEWYEQNLPEKLSRGIPKGLKVNWNKRDEEYVHELKKLVDNLLAQDKEVIQITKSLLSKRIGKHSIISNLNKLPKTKEVLENVIEDRLSYKLRKVDFLCKKLFNEKGKFTRSDITRGVGIYDNEKIDRRINENLKKYLDV